MKKTNKFSETNSGVLFGIIAIVIFCCFITCGIFYAILSSYDYFSTLDDKYKDDGTQEEVIEEGTVGTLNVSGYKKEYYLNEPFDFDKDITIYVTYYNQGSWVPVTINKNTTLTPLSFLKGYPEDLAIPNTATVGTHSFTIKYANAQLVCTYEVVEFNAYHFLNFVESKAVTGSNAMLNIQNVGDISMCNDIAAKNFVSDLSSSLYCDKTNKKYKSLYYLSSIKSILSLAVKSDSINTEIYTPPGETTPSICQRNGNTFTGSMWASFNDTETGIITYDYFNFIVEFTSSNGGIKVTIETSEKTTTVLGNFNLESFNLCVTGEEDYDILLNYSSSMYAYATVTKDLYSNLNTLNYDASFANLQTSSLVYNVTENIHTYNV